MLISYLFLYPWAVFILFYTVHNHIIIKYIIMEQAAGLSQASSFNGLIYNKAECSVFNIAHDLALTITAYSFAR